METAINTENKKKLIPEHWRGLDFYKPDFDKKSKACIIGCGAIGSYAALGLATLGIKELVLIDYDTVESHNLPNQFFAQSLNLTEGLFKTSVLEATIKLMVKDVKITVYPLKIEQIDFDELQDCSVFITSVDDMEVRRFIFDKITNSTHYINNGTLIIDPRIGGLYANVYYCDIKHTSHIDFYKSTLHSNSMALPLPCSGQSICDVSLTIAGAITSRYRTYAMDLEYASLHTVYDMKIGQSYVMVANPNFDMIDLSKNTQMNLDNLQEEVHTSPEDLPNVPSVLSNIGK